MYLIFFLSVVVVTLLWILLGPVIIYLDTQEKQYRVGLPGIIKASVVPSEEIFHIRGRFFLFPFRVFPFGPKKKASPQKRKPKRPAQGLKLGKNILNSFRVRKLDLDIDTDDFMVNVWLVPAFSSINSKNIHMQVNFEGKTSLMLDVRTRLGTLAWALIKTKYQSLFNY